MNQDVFLLAPNLLNQSNLHFFGVGDGHGLHGHDVSNYIKLRLAVILEEQLHSSGCKSKRCNHNHRTFIRDAIERAVLQVD